MSLRAIIVDDEPLARTALSRLLKRERDVTVVGQCGDGESAVHAIRQMQPDLVFLDVQMPEMDGFQVVESIGIEQMPVTVFVTAFDRYAIQAFDANAVDYLLKPFAPDRFLRALARARDSCLGRQDRVAAQRLFSLLGSRYSVPFPPFLPPSPFPLPSPSLPYLLPPFLSLTNWSSNRVKLVKDSYGEALGIARLIIVSQKMRQLRMHRIERKLTSRSAVRSFDASALQPDFRILWKVSIFHR